MRQRKCRGQRRICLCYCSQPAQWKSCCHPGEGGDAGQVEGDVSWWSKVKRAFSPNSAMDRESLVNWRCRRTQPLASALHHQATPTHWLKTAIISLSLLVLGVDSPAGKFCCRSHSSLSSVWSDGSCGWRYLEARPGGQDSWVSPSVISGPFHVVSPGGLAGFFHGSSGFLRAWKAGGRPRSGKASTFYQLSELWSFTVCRRGSQQHVSTQRRDSVRCAGAPQFGGSRWMQPGL